MLNRGGKVIGVEYAVLTKFEGSSFGVPIGHALELLESLRGATRPSRPGPDRGSSRRSPPAPPERVARQTPK